MLVFNGKHMQRSHAHTINSSLEPMTNLKGPMPMNDQFSYWKIRKTVNIFSILIITCDVTCYYDSLYLLSLIHQAITQSSNT